MEHAHHREIRMPLDARLFHPESRIPLQELADSQIEFAVTKEQAYAADETLRVLVQYPINRELQLILQYADIHVRMIVCPEWRLQGIGVR